ncbi:Amino acid/polyamine transporter I family-containing protein [Strongyloides ratti]|uniref:Amino acid/polyamine transporter I family-containing protein n=1 Tax=Strongyloides ratti TaxID=34506 RepID=A0A090L6E8_STRRB|nr:Amino acid/polyamine transporter I family-containing protein [Strongyloides ratti]CEF65307.1 Amino acid/polyamine transporter I family-containing protein [Strongyloides ratti]
MDNGDNNHKMGFFGASSYVIGNIIGSGIFITPSSILRCSGSVGVSLIIWIGCAIIAILGSLCYIELGTSIREAGCDFAYICYVKWYPIAFAFMWVSVLMTYPATIAIISETFGQYLIEGLKQVYDIDKNYLPLLQKLFAFSLLLLVMWMNFFSLSKFAAKFQVIATFAKLISCALVIITGFYFYFFHGWTENLDDMWNESKYDTGSLVMAFYGGLWAYSGWDILNYGAGEIKNPKKNVPLALLSGIIVVATIYIFINIAYFVALDAETMKSSNAVAALFSAKTLGSFSEFIPFLIGILLLGSLNSNLFSGSRYMYAAAKQGHLPACFSCINKATESPRVAVFAQTILAMGISFIGDLDSLIAYCMFGFWAQRIFTLVALLVIRYKMIPVHADAVRMPLWVHYTFLIITVILVIIPIFQEFHVTVLGLTLCGIGFVFYYLLIHSDNLPLFFYKINNYTTLVACIIFDCLPDVKTIMPVVRLKTSSSKILLNGDSQNKLLLEDTSLSSITNITDLSQSTPVDATVPDLHSDEKNIAVRTHSFSRKIW